MQLAEFNFGCRVLAAASDPSNLLSSMDSNTLIAGVVWGAVGTGVFVYGWKQKSVIPLAAGLLLIGFSYFLNSAMLMSVVSILILAGMFWLKKQGY